MLYPLIHLDATLYFHLLPLWICGVFLLGIAWCHIGGLVWNEWCISLGLAQNVAYATTNGKSVTMWQGVVRHKATVSWV